MDKKFAVVCLFALCISLASIAEAAVIHGSIYDVPLKKVLGARIEVNTTPQQYFISTTGDYSFSISKGSYSIKAEFFDQGRLAGFEWENITVADNGDYIIDFVLFPNLDEDDFILGDIEISGVNEVASEPFTGAALRISGEILGGLVIIVVFYLARGRWAGRRSEPDEKKEEEKKEEPIAVQKEEQGQKDDVYYDAEKIVDILKKEGGRATQKDIRKAIPLSEAKISLMIAELEHKGTIEKIKKGRGNIIVLKKE